MPASVNELKNKKIRDEPGEAHHGRAKALLSSGCLLPPAALEPTAPLGQGRHPPPQSLPRSRDRRAARGRRELGVARAATGG